MMDLTIDEKMLILLYSPGTRMGLYGALQHMAVFFIFRMVLHFQPF